VDLPGGIIDSLVKELVLLERVEAKWVLDWLLSLLMCFCLRGAEEWRIGWVLTYVFILDEVR